MTTQSETVQYRPGAPASGEPRKQLKGAVVRFVGDSGDGMQVTGAQFTSAAALAGNDLATFPDFPAEIRAPAGTTYGVSGFQINFASQDVFTPGDAPDVLVAMNPAALKTNLSRLVRGGLLIVNSGAFSSANLKKAGYDTNPLEDGSLDGIETLAIDITKNTVAAVKEAGISTKEANRCKNFWTLGLMFWIYARPLEPTIKWLEGKYQKSPEIALANVLALKAGHAYGETAEVSHYRYEVPPATVPKGTYRNIGGNQATAWGLIAATQLSGLEMVLGTYPITPASDILHELSRHKHFGVTTIQAEDEIAAVCAAIGASYAGKLAVTTTSGPGLALKTEAIGLAIATELPLVIINVQRGGPSTGLPTKTEQADLLQAVYGRNSEAPLCVLAASSPGNCFDMAIEAARLALKYMTPVILLTDGYVANGAEPWRIPDVTTLPKIDVKFRTDPEGFQPFARDPVTLARNWAIPGTPGLTHRIGGLERDYHTGHVSYDPANHDLMCRTRAKKIAGIAHDIPELAIETGDERGKLLVLGWGSTYGAIRTAVTRCREQGLPVSHAQLNYLNPFPKNLGEVLGRFERVLIPELNLGQLSKLVRSEYLREVDSFTKCEGQPFRTDELEDRIRQTLES
ncbi:MAG: 2-oxoacid:acceptor oxidoreductase subunit alpha [Sorangiineae bacterium]|nr:2-oxoacid:acceptor oxidoreductase subunit alpha [Sorangiineae bacterium]MEB2343313.1 2-oxoacid:acceptor oxidoreductase subunit alpha [Deltaproteobacteria bacterium]